MATTFLDNVGRKWSLHCDIGTFKRVRTMTNVDLINVITIDEKASIDLSVLDALCKDVILLVDVLWACVLPEAEKRGITDVEFGESMTGDIIVDALEKLVDEVVAFFPTTKRTLVQRILAELRKRKMQSETTLQQTLQSEEFEKALAEAWGESTESSSNAPEQSE